jgi:regulator of sigma E protease
MDIFIKLSILMSLSLLIVLHELGHFIPAKLFKTRVENSICFLTLNILSKENWRYRVWYRLVALGGYVKISGMIDESMDKEQMALPPQPWEFLPSIPAFNYHVRWSYG